MSEHTIVISEALYSKARRIAEQTARPVEEVIRTRLEQSLTETPLDLPADEQAELRALRYLAEDTLWMIAREQMPTAKQTRLQALMDQNTLGELSSTEYDELTALVEVGQRLTLRKATAMQLLLDRGYRVTLEALQPTDE